MSEQNADELTFQLGLWLSGMESFLNIRNHFFAEESRAKVATRDWSKEFRLTHSTLLVCSRLAFQLRSKIEGEKHNNFQFSSEEVFNLSQTLKDAILLNEGILRAAPLKFGEWSAWSNLLSDKFKSLTVFEGLIRNAEQKGEQSLPKNLLKILESKPISFAAKADIQLVLPRLAKILKWLDVIGEMLENDEPLKPSLLLFSRIYEQINEMTSFINNRLLRFPEEENELFETLDGAAYTASLELRKVFNHELSGLVDLRPTPSVYAKIETAHALLNDSFQLTLITFAKLIEPLTEPEQIFPSLKTKFERSVILREKMWSVLEDVRQAEQQPDHFPLATLHEKLNDFRETTQHFLFYKDKETTERFIEEVLITKNKKDLVPILHRFGAYLETLFGQINMRVVLSNNPFDQTPS